MEPSIFEEFISLCYRIAMTETAGVQAHLVEVLSLAVSQGFNGGSEARWVICALLDKSDIFSAPRLILLSLLSAPAHCLRVCAHILRSSFSRARGRMLCYNF